MTAPITPAAVNAAPPAPPPPPPPPQPDASTQTQFSAQLQKPTDANAAAATQKVDPSQRIDQLRQTIDATRVTSAGKTEGGMNPFKRMDSVMQDFEKFMQNADKLEPDQRMGQLFQFQMQVQRASFDVQLVSKVVEHATSGARTILQTQA